MIRQIIFYKHYFLDFYNGQSKKMREKIDYVLDMVAFIDRVPKQYFKHLEGREGLYEIRVQQGNNTSRIFCCFDEGKLVVLFNGFVKKTDKTPRQELEKAARLKKEYFEEKSKTRKK